jgi:hypothetical protein
MSKMIPAIALALIITLMADKAWEVIRPQVATLIWSGACAHGQMSVRERDIYCK